MHTFHWSGHSASLLRGIKELYDSCENVDCVLECDGGLLRGHRVVLAASSGYLRNLFKEHENTLYVPLKEVKFRSMQKIFHFVYNGSVNVPTIQVPDVMKTANLLEITPLQMCFFSVFLGNPSKKNCVEPLENLHSDDRVSTDNELHISKCISWSKNKRIVGVRRDEKNIDELEVCDEGMDRVLDLNVVKDEVNRAETEGEQGGASLPDTFLEVTLPCVKKEEVWEEGGNGDVSCSDPLGQVSSQEKPSDGESWKSEQKPCCAFEMKTETEKEDKEEVQCLFEKSDRERRERAERRSEVIQVKKEENEGPMEKSEQHNGCIRLKTKSENVFHLKEARVVLERISSATINNLGATMVNSSVAVDSSTRRLVSEGPPSLEERRNNCHEEKSLNCSHCVAVFISNKEYKNHLYSHLEKEQYLCHICGLQYGSRVKLVVHLRFHKRGKKFSCTQCSVTCSSKELFTDNKRKETVPLKGVMYKDMKVHVDLIYYGEVVVPMTDVESVVKTVQLLKIASFTKRLSQDVSENLPQDIIYEQITCTNEAPCDVYLIKNYEVDFSLQGNTEISSQAQLFEGEHSMGFSCDSADFLDGFHSDEEIAAKLCNS